MFQPLSQTHESSPHCQTGLELTESDLANGWNRQNTSIAPDFLERFYKNSRLHHLSTWRAELKQMIANNQSTFRERRTKRTDDEDQIVMHVDFDAFFASVGLLDRPHLINRPVGVCHAKGTSTKIDSSSEIASVNYIARSYGISNGMHVGDAQRLCPNLITIPYEFEKYHAVSLRFYEILIKYATELQALSIDEALIEVGRTVREDYGGDAEEFARQLRKEIKNETRCDVSMGISKNILLARMATTYAKPRGQFYIKDDYIDEFLENQNVDSLPGVGSSMAQRLGEKGVITIADLKNLTMGELQAEFGPKAGKTLYNFARGIDKRSIQVDSPRKSVSAEVAWGVRFENDEQVEKFLHELCEEAVKRLKDVKLKTKSVMLKIKLRKPEAGAPPKLLGCGDCDNFSKSKTFAYYTDSFELIWNECLALLKQFGCSCVEIRGIGIQLQKLNTETGKGHKSLSDYYKSAADAEGREEQPADSNDQSQQCYDESLIGDEESRMDIISSSPDLSSPFNNGVCEPSRNCERNQESIERNVDENRSHTLQQRHPSYSEPGNSVPMFVPVKMEFDDDNMMLGGESSCSQMRNESEMLKMEEDTEIERNSIIDRPNERDLPCQETWNELPHSRLITANYKVSKKTVSKNNRSRKNTLQKPPRRKSKIEDESRGLNLDKNGEFDRDVFDALPKEIQKEIMIEFRFHTPLRNLRPIHKKVKTESDELTKYPSGWL
ncbi:2960_t:CDS:10 [Paraglomus brasilianum]|uniref:DNA repair protein REV1 n=1 Tax=Paraglomus brasilianum TaxID=144538 RepID=A0A9N8WHI5_9GLOM|nr:2960_t:CDS:10 [Paraglomus brasilianum]